jgi:hypothetical protein
MKHALRRRECGPDRRLDPAAKGGDYWLAIAQPTIP